MSAVDALSKRLFGPGSLQVTNIGITRGTNPNTSAESIAAEIARSLDSLERGDFETVEVDD